MDLVISMNDMDINKIYNEDCLETMERMDDNFIDLAVTSPPYDNLRTYNNDIDKTWDESVWKPIIKELYRVTKDGGVVVWVVSDATINGSETGTSFRQALWTMECGFNLHDTMIYKQKGTGAKGSNKAYWQSFDYMFVFSKGKIKTVNRINDVKNTAGGKKRSHSNSKKYEKIGSRTERNNIKNPIWSVRPNVWEYAQGVNDRTDHTAPFPEKLANDHIISWSNEGDLVYDPFMGSGTTAKMSILNNRNWIGSEISKEYCDIVKKRIKIGFKEKEYQDKIKNMEIF